MEKINDKTYKIEEKVLGKGAFGTVHLGIIIEDHQKIALKELPEKMGNEELESISNELEISSKLDNRNIVRMLEIVNLGGKRYLAYELCNGGDLRKYMNYLKTFDEELIQIIMIKIINGLKELHKKRVIHHDIKPENILIQLHFNEKTENDINSRLEYIENMLKERKEKKKNKNYYINNNLFNQNNNQQMNIQNYFMNNNPNNYNNMNNNFPNLNNFQQNNFNNNNQFYTFQNNNNNLMNQNNNNQYNIQINCNNPINNNMMYPNNNFMNQNNSMMNPNNNMMNPNNNMMNQNNNMMNQNNNMMNPNSNIINTNNNMINPNNNNVMHQNINVMNPNSNMMNPNNNMMNPYNNMMDPNSNMMNPNSNMINPNNNMMNPNNIMMNQNNMINQNYNHINSNNLAANNNHNNNNNINQNCNVNQNNNINQNINNDQKAEDSDEKYIVDVLKNAQYKLSDFGLSKLRDETIDKNLAGSPLYMGPELFQTESSIKTIENFQVDIWAVGVLAFEMFFGRRPFEAFSIKELSDMYQTGEYYIDLKGTISKEFFCFLNMCLQKDPKQRANVDQLFNSKFINHTFDTLEKMDKNQLMESLGNSVKIDNKGNIILMIDKYYLK